ncbi:hypothetical protein SUDANB58_02473 [Streptomyces sp. enrichment culture]|uniref:effector-associated constant component EACC1 n=1 Tax=Streptomyces sp. enrichment culture TaxID=1795815 RepID=UPI003F54A3DD
MHSYHLSLTDHNEGAGLRTLARWLRGDEEVSTEAEINLVTTPPREGEMGSAFEAIQVVVDNGFQVANLVVAIAAWRRTTPNKPEVIIERNGTRVTIHSDDAEVISQITRTLSEES